MFVCCFLCFFLLYRSRSKTAHNDDGKKSKKKRLSKTTAKPFKSLTAADVLQMNINNEYSDLTTSSSSNHDDNDDDTTMKSLKRDKQTNKNKQKQQQTVIDDPSILYPMKYTTIDDNNNNNIDQSSVQQPNTNINNNNMNIDDNNNINQLPSEQTNTNTNNNNMNVVNNNNINQPSPKQTNTNTNNNNIVDDNNINQPQQQLNDNNNNEDDEDDDDDDDEDVIILSPKPKNDDITDFIIPLSRPLFKMTARKSPRGSTPDIITKNDIKKLSDELKKVKSDYHQQYGVRMTKEQCDRWIKNTVKDIRQSRTRSKTAPKRPRRKKTKTKIKKNKKIKSKIDLNRMNDVNNDESTQRGIQNKISTSHKLKIQNVRKFVLDKRVHTNSDISLLGQSFNNTYRLKHAVHGGGGNFPLSKYRFRSMSGNAVVTPRITGLTDNDIYYLMKRDVNVYSISRRNSMEGYGLITKPLWSKQVKVMKKDEKRLRRYCNDREISIWIENHVNNYADWWDLTFSWNLVNKFYTQYSDKFNFNKILNVWLKTRDPTSFVFVCLCPTNFILSFS